MTTDTPSKQTKVCPICGTRVNEDAERCLVCGSSFSQQDTSGKKAPNVQGSRMPTITLSLPIAIVLLALFLIIGAVLVYYALQQTGQVVEPTVTLTVTNTATTTITPTPMTPTPTPTQQPTPTPLTYKVSSGDTCSSIAFAFGVSIQSIVLENTLPAACDTLIVGQDLRIPHPTPTNTPLPTATLSAADATDAACQKIDYTVQENDTLSSISANYAVPITVLKTYNGLVNDTVRSGQTIVIPLCERNATPGPSPTPTPPPPYGAPNLLLPADGAPFLLTDETITLQWASVGALRNNEAYAVTIIDVTEGQDRRLIDYVTDTKFILPDSFRPASEIPHVMRWWVVSVRQTGTDDDGNAIWESAGAESARRVFTITGISTIQTPSP
jgi:LysM repeat protein